MSESIFFKSIIAYQGPPAKSWLLGLAVSKEASCQLKLEETPQFTWELDRVTSRDITKTGAPRKRGGSGRLGVILASSLPGMWLWAKPLIHEPVSPSTQLGCGHLPGRVA